MCGILALIQTKKKEIPKDLDLLLEANKRRGPDHQSKYCIELESNDKKISIELNGFVLHLRGEKVIPQPIISSSGDVLCFNGEVFGGLEVKQNENDALILFQNLEKMSDENDIINLLDFIQGPHAFMFYKASLKTIYFGRDKLGIRSLLQREETEDFNGLCFTSVSTKSDSQQEDINYHEIDTKTMYKIHLNDYLIDTGNKNIKEYIKIIQRPSCNGFESLPSYLKINNIACDDLKADDKIDDERYLSYIIEENSDVLTKFYGLLSESVYKRVSTLPLKEESDNKSRLAILFSGGIDCTILAYLAHQHIPINEDIDLFNVAFENPRTKISNFNVPDRKTGLNSLKELNSLCPGRKFNFVYIDIPYTEVTQHQNYIKYLIHPSDTVMDLSIALAFWFSSRGKGFIIEEDKKIEYKSEAKVLLSGLGADEQLGGYSRHRTAFEVGSWGQLIKEVQLDVSRINTRNLGRDDRVCTDWSKEVRYPYLDINFIKYVNDIPIHNKMDLRYPRGIGEKAILRALAKKLGFINLPNLFKRAVQFGARTAKMLPSDSKVKGHEKMN